MGMTAGLGDESIPNHIKIVPEPDCALLSIQHQIADLQRRNTVVSREEVSVIAATDCPLSQTQSLSMFGNGCKYMLIDAGAGTVDVSCHQSMGNMKIKEVLCPSGGNWGSGLIDEGFITLLDDIFSAEWIHKFKSMHTRHWQAVVESFRASKHSFHAQHGLTEKVSSRCTHSVKLNVEFIAFLEDQCHLDGVTLKGLVADCVYSNDIALNGVYLNLSYNIWRNVLFQTVMTPILEHVASCLSTPQMADCASICLVGGLAASRYFEHRMHLQFGDRMSIVVPRHPVLSVVDGAALFGLFNQFVQCRVLAKCYGTSVNSKQLNKVWMDKGMVGRLSESERQRHWNRKRKCFSKIFKPIVRRNEVVSIDGKPIVIEGARNTVRRVQKYTSIKIYQCDGYGQGFDTFFINTNSVDHPVRAKQNKDVVTERSQNGNMKLMATANIVWPTDDKERNKIILELYFHDTIICGYVYAEKYPDDNKALQLKYEFH